MIKLVTHFVCSLYTWAVGIDNLIGYISSQFSFISEAGNNIDRLFKYKERLSFPSWDGVLERIYWSSSFLHAFGALTPSLFVLFFISSVIYSSLVSFFFLSWSHNSQFNYTSTHVAFFLQILCKKLKVFCSNTTNSLETRHWGTLSRDMDQSIMSIEI